MSYTCIDFVIIAKNQIPRIPQHSHFLRHIRFSYPLRTKRNIIIILFDKIYLSTMLTCPPLVTLKHSHTILFFISSPESHCSYLQRSYVLVSISHCTHCYSPLLRMIYPMMDSMIITFENHTLKMSPFYSYTFIPFLSKR